MNRVTKPDNRKEDDGSFHRLPSFFVSFVFVSACWVFSLFFYPRITGVKRVAARKLRRIGYLTVFSLW